MSMEHLVRQARCAKGVTGGVHSTDQRSVPR